MKGFISAAIAALALAAIVVSISFSLTATSNAKSAVDSANAMAVAERADDAQAFFAETLDDAIIDGAWSTCGCNKSNSTSFGVAVQALSAQYFNSSAALITADGINVSASQPIVFVPAVSSCNAAVGVNASYILQAAGQGAKTSRAVGLSRNVSLLQGSGFVQFSITPAIGGGAPLFLQISC